MKKSLYFICPTDYLESIIKSQFNGESYFFSSLGNSIELDKDVLGQIKYLIELNRINSISFVLAKDNPICLDACQKSNYLHITGLRSFYAQFLNTKKFTDVFWKTTNDDQLLLSYHLNSKIRELRESLNGQFFFESGH